MHTKRNAIIWLIALALAIPGVVDARKGRLIGKVVDPDGNPIADVSVTVSCDEVPQGGFLEIHTTNNKGVFKVDFDWLGYTYKYKFEKVGYVTTQANQDWSKEGTDRHEFTMHPGESSPDAGLPPPSTSNEAIDAYNEGVKEFSASNYPAAITKFKESLEHDPELDQAWAVLTVAYLQNKQYEETVEAAEKAIEKDAANETVMKSRWEAYRKLGNKEMADKAREELERVAEMAEEAKKIYNEGVTLVKAGDEATALTKFQEALEIDPKLEVALVGVATSALKLDKYAEAADAAEAILKTDPQNERAIRIRYNACLGLADDERLLDALVGLAVIDPATSRNSLFRLATRAYDAFEIDRAKQLFSKVFEVDPNHPRAHYYLGLIMTQEGNNAEAKALLERFVTLAPEDPEAANAQEILNYLESS